jgi:superoxide reductase
MVERISEKIQTADWKSEKHVPVIECPEIFNAGETVEVKVAVGKDISHPNTTEHHIRWMRVYFVPDDSNFAYDIGNFEFNAHGESPAGANKGPVYTHHKVKFMFKTDKPGSLNIISYCNIHGLWESSKRIQVK